MSSKFSVIIFIVTLILLVGGLILVTRKPAVSGANLDEFAKCLSQQGMVMYGAYWCSHCQNIKKLFASSFQYINYVECTVDTNTCNQKGINGYPSFTFSDGSKVEGEMTLAEFSQKTSCPLPEQ